MKGLVHAGGGIRGAWCAGMLRYLLGELGIKYDILCGVSVGAINVAFLSQFPHGEEKEASEQLWNLWSNVSNKSIYKRWWPWGRWHSLWNASFFDSSPMYKLIKDNLSLDRIRSSGKKVSVGAISLNSGKYTIFNQDNDDFVDAVVASASVPGMFSPVKIKDQLWIDGGSKEMSPFKTAVDMGAKEIDAIITYPEVRVPLWIEKPTTADVLKRSFDLSLDKIMFNDIEKMKMYNSLAYAGLVAGSPVKLNIIQPKYNLVEESLNFSGKKIKEMLEKGYNDAKEKFSYIIK